ncbi:MAG: HAD family hydrolase, partial [Lachnospiraceae bacterium]|nr:HAD family hydrolase [Lachnospiraceae bacterium]
MLKAVIFDFDYTLGDTTNGIVLSVNYALEKLGFDIRDKEEIKKTVGLSLKDTFFTLTGRQNEEQAEQFSKYFREKADLVMVESAQLYDDTKEVLQKLKNDGYKISIVTTKFRYRIEHILDKFDASNLIDLIVGAEDVKVEKPNPEGLLWAMDSLKLGKNEILYVGDSIVDAKTAENAQVDFAGVLTGTTVADEFKMYRNVFIGEHITDVYNFIMNCNHTRK